MTEIDTELASEAAFIRQRRKENQVASNAADKGEILGSKATPAGVNAFSKTRVLTPSLLRKALEKVSRKK